MPRDHVNEFKTSRIGSVVGDTSLSLPRLFYVEQIERGADPVLFLKKKGRGHIPEGSGHPWDFNAKAKVYRIVDNVGTHGHLISVDYRYEPTAVALGILGPWVLRFRSAEIPRRLEQELRDFDNDGNLTVKPRLIGPNKYVDVDADLEEGETPDTHTHTAKIDDKIVRLKRLEQREVKGADAPLPAASMILEREQASFNVLNIGEILSFKHKVNDTNFFGGAAGHVEFLDWSIDPLPTPTNQGDLTGRGSRPSIRHRLSLTFIYSSVRLDIEPYMHTFEGKDGGLSFIEPIEPAGISLDTNAALFLRDGKVGENFKIRNRANLGTLLGLF